MNEKSIVIYKSKYGSTKKYAQWIAESLTCPVKDIKDVSAKDLAQYDTIIYGGGLYAGGISGFKKFLSLLDLKNLKNWESKELVMFMVGTTNPRDTERYQEVANRNIPDEYKDKFKVFWFRGDQLFSKMNGLHKLMMRMPKAMAEKKTVEERTEDDKIFIENFGKDIIFSSREQIDPLVGYLMEQR